MLLLIKSIYIKSHTAIIKRYQLEREYLKKLFKSISYRLKTIWRYKITKYFVFTGVYSGLASLIYALLQQRITDIATPWRILNLFLHSNSAFETGPFLIALALPILLAFIIILIWQRYPEHSYKIIGGSITLIIYVYLCLALSEQIFFKLLGYDTTDKNPLNFFYIWHEFAGYPSIMHKLVIALLIPGVLTIALAWACIHHRNSHIFGNAHWANMLEAEKAGLFAKEGIIIGKKWGRYLRVGGFEHIIAFAPTGSGKTSTLVIPNLLSWQDSCVCNDPKLELYQKTSKHRQQQGQSCYVWNPGGDYTHCYNPLDFISTDKIKRIDDIQKIANIFIPDNPKTEAIWTAQPRLLFMALVLLVLDTPNMPKTIGQIVRIVKNTPNFVAYIYELVSLRDDLDPLCYRNFNSFLQINEKTRASVLTTFLAPFELFDNPLIDAATSKSDFNLNDLRKKKMTIYIGVSLDNIVRMSRLLAVFNQQILDSLIRSLPDLTIEPYSVLLLLEEFAALPPMELYKNSIGLIRQYRVRMMMIIQDLPQLYDKYGYEGAKVFINSKYRIAFAQNDKNAAELISDAIGPETVKNYSISQRVSGVKQDVSETQSFTKRELMAANEITKLNRNKSIILIEAHPPVLASKCFWDKEPLFKFCEVGAVNLPKIVPILYPFDKALLKNLTEFEDISFNTDKTVSDYILNSNDTTEWKLT